MKKLFLIGLIFNVVQSPAEIVEPKVFLSDKDEVYKALFLERNELEDKDCHRNVHESRSPRTMIAMGCKLVNLEIGPLDTSKSKRYFKATYECDSGNYPFTAFCFIKKKPL